MLDDAQAHLREGIGPLTFKFNPPVSLSAYKLKDFDPNGNWYLWQKREDWQKTSMGLIGEPGPKYAMYIAPGPSDNGSSRRPSTTST